MLFSAVCRLYKHLPLNYKSISAIKSRKLDFELISSIITAA